MPLAGMRDVRRLAASAPSAYATISAGLMRIEGRCPASIPAARCQIAETFFRHKMASTGGAMAGSSEMMEPMPGWPRNGVRSPSSWSSLLASVANSAPNRNDSVSASSGASICDIALSAPRHS